MSPGVGDLGRGSIRCTARVWLGCPRWEWEPARGRVCLGLSWGWIEAGFVGTVLGGVGWGCPGAGSGCFWGVRVGWDCPKVCVCVVSWGVPRWGWGLSQGSGEGWDERLSWEAGAGMAVKVACVARGPGTRGGSGHWQPLASPLRPHLPPSLVQDFEQAPGQLPGGGAALARMHRALSVLHERPQQRAGGEEPRGDPLTCRGWGIREQEAGAGRGS